jgi:hypothetical protein
MTKSSDIFIGGSPVENSVESLDYLIAETAEIAERRI